MKRSPRQTGFTLIEMLVIAPIVILAIGAFLTVIISMTGEVLASRASNILTYNVQDALNRIEQDVKLSTTFLPQNNITLATGGQQGYNNDDTTNFTNVGGASGTALILNAIVTNNNPLSNSAGIVYLANSPNACTAGNVSSNTPMTMNIVYFVKDMTLWRRTIMPSNYQACTTPWQQPSCAPQYTSTFCKTNDIKLVEGVSDANFVVEYFSDATTTTKDSTASNTSASTTARAAALQATTTVGVTIKASQIVAGRNVERSAELRATRLDTNATTLPSANTTYYNIITNGSFETPLATTFTTNTNLHTNPSLETNATGYAAANGSTITRQTASAIEGSYGLRVAVPSGAISDSGVSLGTISVTSGNTYTVSTAVRAVTAGTYRISAQGSYAPTITNSTVMTAGSVLRLSATFTATGTGSQSVYLLRTGTGTAHNFDVDKTIYEQSIQNTGFFTGSTAGAGDFSYSWTGTADASTSLEKGVRLPSLLSTYRATPIQSSDWASNGSRSLRLIPSSTTNSDSFVLIDDLIPGGPSALKPNTVYTFRVKMRLASPLTGSLLGGSQTLSVFLFLDNSLRGSWIGTNTAGTQTLGGTFTTPSVLTNYNSLRLYHGGLAGSGSVWWDDLMLVEGNYGGSDYIPGS